MEFLTADGSVSRVVTGEWSFDGTNNTEDCNGHGTATASLAGGRPVGTAPNATLHAIRAIGCDGQAQIADIIFRVAICTFRLIQCYIANHCQVTCDWPGVDSQA